MERSLVLIKPDAVERGLIGEIISIYEKKGLNITALRLIKPSKEIAESHYGEQNRFFKNWSRFLPEERYAR